MKYALSLLLFLSSVGAFAPISSANEADISNANSWSLQLENASFTELKNSSSDVLVIHSSLDGTGQQEFSPAQIAELKQMGKTVLMYISVAEAQTYEFYWDPDWERAPEQAPCFETYWKKYTQELDSRRCNDGKKPQWLGKKNPKTGGYYVRYWSDEWWETALAPYLEKIRALDADGIYLDFGTTFEYWNEQNPKTYSDQFLAKTSARLTRKVAGQMPNSLIISTNGIDTFGFLQRSEQQKLLQSIDAVVAEDFWYNSSRLEQRRIQRQIKLFAQEQKVIFSLEKIPHQKQKQYLQKIENFSFTPSRSVQVNRDDLDVVTRMRIRRRQQQRYSLPVLSVKILPFEMTKN